MAPKVAKQTRAAADTKAVESGRLYNWLHLSLGATEPGQRQGRKREREREREAEGKQNESSCEQAKSRKMLQALVSDSYQYFTDIC